MVLAVMRPALYNERSVFKYFLTMTNLFQTVFNSLPQLFIQTAYFSKHFYLQNPDYFSSASPLLTLVGLKITITLFRISYNSASFVNYFLVNEFKYQNFESHNSWLFIFFRFLSNLFILGFRFLPLVIISEHLIKTFYLLILLRYIRSFIFELLIFIPDFSWTNKHTFLSVFWCFFLSVQKTSVLINELESFHLKLGDISNFCVRVINFLAILIETCTVYLLLFIYLKIEVSAMTLCLSLLMYICQLSIEYVYWRVINPKKLFIRRNFANWILLQCDQAQVHSEFKIDLVTSETFIDNRESNIN